MKFCTAFCILQGVLLVPQSHAQCPVGANPLQTLVGSWTYSTHGSIAELSSASGGTPFAAAGQFVARVGTDKSGIPVGLLSITQTSSKNGQISRLENDVGTYQIFPDCTGGTLTFNLSTGPMSLDFWFSTSSTPIFAGAPPPPSPGCGTGLRFVNNSPNVSVSGDAQVICATPTVLCSPSFADAKACSCQSGGPIGNPIPLGCPANGPCSPGNDATTACGSLHVQKPSCSSFPATFPTTYQCFAGQCTCSIP